MLRAIIPLITLLLLIHGASAAEVTWKSQVCVSSSLVNLQDAAAVSHADAAEASRLGGITLFPAPAAGRARVVRTRELESLLRLHAPGVAWNFAGAEIIEITAKQPAAVPVPSQPMEPQAFSLPAAEPIPAQIPDFVREKAARAVQGYLSSFNAEAAWEVEIVPTADLKTLVSPASQITAVGGGVSPWLGNQQFSLQVKAEGKTIAIPVQANITQADLIVTAVRQVPRGAVLTAADVQLVVPPPRSAIREPVYQLEEVVGKETLRSLTPGQPLVKGAVRSPILVQRGEIVEVTARAAGVQVRTTAKALAAGSQGEVVMVETLESRESYAARIVGRRRVEVYARSPSTSDLK